MKRFIVLCFLVITTLAQAQSDSIRKIEPDKKTSFTNQDLILIALAALALLIAIYFLFRRARGTRN
jgi:hypothetical protein